MPQTIDAVAVRGHLAEKTTQELCDDYRHLVNSKRRMSWAEQAISDALFERNEVAWVEWQLGGNLFGPSMPHRFFGLI
ncbi:hypothetical protein HKX69_05990 [Streptomyces argyrophyllae]|uniref:Uncharacterized protein n=1 Tax=Streptomyces argyrophylli TaxID=2726118 RepID=A0A6M4PFU8_9ACTN|nr:hypothetical protein [Streptomyces argyrophyllae]QJS09123.1 hypothetical protein HKX69_05990 [Streptomyces argyrophyllae]